MPTTCYNSPKQVSLQSTSLIWHSHVTYQFYFSTFLKQTLMLAKDLASAPPPPTSWKQTLPSLCERFSSSDSYFFLFLLNQMNRFVLMPYREWPIWWLSAVHLASPRLVVLVVIATRHGRAQGHSSDIKARLAIWGGPLVVRGLYAPG